MTGTANLADWREKITEDHWRFVVMSARDIRHVWDCRRTVHGGTTWTVRAAHSARPTEHASMQAAHCDLILRGLTDDVLTEFRAILSSGISPGWSTTRRLEYRGLMERGLLAWVEKRPETPERPSWNEMELTDLAKLLANHLDRSADRSADRPTEETSA